MMEKYTLDMHMVGNNMYVYADFWNRRTMRYSKGIFTFDTGASVTTISSDILFNLGYNVTDGNIEQISTASSIEYVRETTIDKIMLENCEIENVKVYAHTFPAAGFSTGVIGLNILSLFDIHLLFSKQRIEFTKIKN